MGLFDKIDVNLFNTDPKFEQDRTAFDALTEASMKRVIEKQKKENPAPEDDENIFDSLFGNKKKAGGENGK